MTGRSIVKFLFAIAECGALLIIGLGPSSAQESSVLPKVGDSVQQYFKVPPRDGEFRKASSPGMQSIACVTILEPGASPPSGPGYNNCLRLGSLKLGMEFYRLQIALADLKTIPEQNIVHPRIVNKSPDGVLTVLVPISTVQSGDQIRMQSYLVALLDNSGTVKSLQLTGKPSETTTALHFSGITLGIPKEKVVDILGFPSSVSDVPEIRGKLWNYSPFPFTIEFSNDKVYSVRIHSPSESDYQKVFTPLSSIPD